MPYPTLPRSINGVSVCYACITEQQQIATASTSSGRIYVVAKYIQYNMSVSLTGTILASSGRASSRYLGTYLHMLLTQLAWNELMFAMGIASCSYAFHVKSTTSPVLRVFYATPQRRFRNARTLYKIN